MKPKWNYLLCGKAFFRDEYSGQANHALGCLSGLTEIGMYEPHVFADSSVKNIQTQAIVHELHDAGTLIKRVWLIRSLLNEWAEDDSVKVIHIRKNWVFQIYLLMSFGQLGYVCSKKDVIIEINGLGFQTKKFLPISFLSYLYDKGLVLFLPEPARIYTVHQRLSDRLTSLKCKNVIKTIPNGAPKLKKLDLGLTKGRVLIFFGVLQEYNDYDVLKDVSSLFDDVLIFGRGRCVQEIRRMAQTSQKIQYRGPIGIEALQKDYLTDGRQYFGIVPQRESRMTSYQSPVKLFSYSALGLPVFVSKGVQLSVSDRSDHIIPYESSSHLQRLIVKVCENQELYSKLSRAAYRFAKDNDWSVRMATLSP